MKKIKTKTLISRWRETKFYHKNAAPTSRALCAGSRHGAISLDPANKSRDVEIKNKSISRLIIAGVDEVGRGPLAGPVITAAVILSQPIPGIKDSKKLTETQRERLAATIQHAALCFAYGRADVEEIDQLNIHFATLLAMKRAIDNLSITPDEVLVDGRFTPAIATPCKAIIKGDSYPNEGGVIEISAASILAKVLRDNEMKQMDYDYPGYGFATHKGYPTKQHYHALQALGPCPIHRQSFNLGA